MDVDYSKRAVVTGGAGFIGSHFIDRLVAEGWTVSVLDNFYSGFSQNLSHHKGNVTVIGGSITDKELVASVIKKGDTVWHFAAMNSVPRSIEQPLETNTVNVNGTLNILIAARDKGAKRVIYSGSSSAYGNNKKEIKDESLPTHPISPYGLSKFTGEEYCRLFTDIYGLETATLRYFNVFGPRQNPNSPYSAVIPLFIQALIDNKEITVFGDGYQSRDFTYVDNVVEANFLAGTHNALLSGTYNVACGGSISLNEIISSLEKTTNYKYSVLHKPERLGDIKSSRASIDKISSCLGYKPLVEFDEGLEKTLKWFRENPNYFKK